MNDLKPQIRDLASTIEAKEAEAAQEFTAFKTLRDSAVKEGVDFAKNTDAFDKLDAASKKFDTIKQEVASLKDRRARLLEMAGDQAVDMAAKGGDAAVARTFGEKFVNSEVYREAKARVSGNDSVALGASAGVKIIERGQVKTVLTSAGAVSPVPDRQGFIVAKPLAPLSILDVIAIESTDSDVVEWLEETTYTNAAAETAEGLAAPESAIAFTKRTANVHEIDHFLPVTRRALNDQAFIESWINNRIVDGVKRRLAGQILNGGGIGEDLAGIYGNASIGVIDRSVLTLGMLDSLHRCLTTIRLNALDYGEPDFVGISPDDYETIRTSKAATTGEYLFGDPISNGPKTIWGIPAIVSAAFTSGTPLVGIGKEAMLFVREGVSVALSDSHSDYFVKKQVAILGSMRVAFGVLQPKAFALSQA